MGATEKRMEQLGIQLQQTDWRGKGAVDVYKRQVHLPERHTMSGVTRGAIEKVI